MLQHYDFVNPDIMSYFSRRLTQAPRDAGFALDYVKEHAKTPAEREAVCNALIFKTNVLWVQLDALYHAYVDGHIPPRAFVPKGLEDDGAAATSVSARQAGRSSAPRQAEIRRDAEGLGDPGAGARAGAGRDRGRGPAALRRRAQGLRHGRSACRQIAAPREAILTDVVAMLQDLADKGFLTEAREKTP